MADIFQDTFPGTPPSFSEGEVPTPTKFTDWAALANSGMRLLDRAIGDVWGEQTQVQVDSTEYILSTWNDRPLNIANLARLIGPASALNPGRLGNRSVLIAFDGTDIPANVHEFQLPEPSLLINQTGKVFSINVDVSMSDNHLGKQLNTIDNTVFATHRSSKTECTADGHYNVDKQGRVYCYKETGTYGATSRDYYTDMLWDTYSMARMNVIPDINETTTLCTVAAAASGKQLITLPAVTKLPSYDDDGTVRTLPGSMTARLPASITTQLDSGDTIPEGFVYLWDTVNDEICTNAAGNFIVFQYASASTLYALNTTNLVSANNTTYRLITVGATITETLGELTYNFRNHAHTEDSRQGQPIDHSNLIGGKITAEEIDSVYGTDFGGFRHSVIEGHDHPQYLMRYGWDSGIDPGNQDNAMLGHLYMASVVNDYRDVDAYKTASKESYQICFGSTSSNYLYLNADGDMELSVASGNFDFAQCTFGRMPTQSTGADPSGGTPGAGTFIFDTSNKKLYIHDGSNWLETAALS